MYEIMQMGMMMTLAAVAVWDILYRKFRVGVLLLILFLAIGCKLLAGNMVIVDMIAGMVVGCGFLLISKLTNEAFGYADSLMILTLGIFMGVWELFLLLILAFSLAAIFAGAGMLLKKFSKDFSIPFIPFLAVSYAGVMMIG